MLGCAHNISKKQNGRKDERNPGKGPKSVRYLHGKFSCLVENPVFELNDKYPVPAVNKVARSLQFLVSKPVLCKLTLAVSGSRRTGLKE
jgi:hypothetical protein